ncbi:MAG: DAK2 domain-containing protein [Clostridia bacterium]|nr:DAK2 domain-containing protein [Clostridia bacterium]
MSGNDRIIDGEGLKRLFYSGAMNLKANAKEVNDLNVFPIPDGDTGENMYLTIKGGVDEIEGLENGTVSAVSESFARGMLFNARGNSGVILSQLFFGLSEGLKDRDTVTLKDFAHALKQGVKRAYGAVAEPVEGTILTVARESAESVNSALNEDTTAGEFFKEMLNEMKKSLEHTPELLDALKEAGVIDSGGAGLVYIIEGFYKAIIGDDAFGEIAITSDGAKKAIDLTKFNENSVMEYGYCTEFLLQLQHSKTDISAFSVKALIEFLGTVGDSIVAFLTGTVVKVHVHTLEPWKVLKHCQQFGEFLTIKIENMTLQHNETERGSTVSEMNKKVKKARRKYAVVTVATGQGLINTFKEIGADYVISGGQTNNPSSEDFITAFDSVNADYIFVLPNNSNIVLTAKQAAAMYKDSDIRVVESKSIGEGYSALSMLDYESDNPDEIFNNLSEDMKSSVTGMLTKAVRTTTVNGVSVNKDDYIGFTNKTMLVSTPEKMESVYSLTEKLIDDEKAFLIVAYGKGATKNERAAYSAFVRKEFSQIELYEIDGEQDVYDFILIVE